VETPERVVELRLADGYTGGKPIRYLAARWHDKPGTGNWQSRVAQYTGRNFTKALAHFDKNVADGRDMGATVAVGKTMRELWDAMAVNA
jgi:hypothetical protein